MKNIHKILGFALLSVLIIVPVAVWAYGWGMMGNGHMMGFGNGHYWNHDGDDGTFATLNTEQKQRLSDLNRKFYNETETLRERLWSKSSELDDVLAVENPDLEKAKALQKEISGLRTKLDEMTVNYRFEARKIVPSYHFDNGYGMHQMMGGYGMNHMMGGYRMDYGYDQSPCWD